jgi:predicted acetyltransferase
MAHDQEVVGSNPDIVYWMDVSVARYYIIKNYGNKGSQLGAPKNTFFNETNKFTILKQNKKNTFL